LVKLAPISERYSKRVSQIITLAPLFILMLFGFMLFGLGECANGPHRRATILACYSSRTGCSAARTTDVIDPVVDR
jgi:hypothetical protein